MMRLSQEMKLSQKLDVRMIQSLKLLPLTTMQLEQRINEELEQNPMLQLEEAKEQAQENPPKIVDESGQVNTNSMDDNHDGDFTEADWQKYIEDGFDNKYNVRGEYDPNIEEMEMTHTYTHTLSEHLIEQLGMVMKNERDREIGEFIIGCINDDGFLELTDEEIAGDMSITTDEVRRIVLIIQQFEPSGVGAQNLRESFIIQLRDRELENSLAWKIVYDHYDNLLNRRLKQIMHVLKISREELKKAIDIISSLTPRPGAIFKDMVASTAIIPDLIVEKVEGDYVVILNDNYIPRLNISANYRRLLDKKADTSQETRKYLVDKLNSARWFINSIEQRRTTILRVANEIIKQQSNFLDHGVSRLKPMTLQDVADNIKVAISTVQRVTIGKYIQTPQGVFELKYFFDQRIASSDGSEDYSAKSVKEKLRKLIENENPSKPFSDQMFTDILNEQGISISRRAIAKYRDELQIPPARLRKQL